MNEWERLLESTARMARDWLGGLGERRVFPDESPDELRERFGAELPEAGEDPVQVIEDLAAAAMPGLVASPGPRYFGFVIGGTLPAAVAADWLTSAWDQNAGLYVASPASAIIEDIAGRWVLDGAGWDVDANGLPGAPSVRVIVGDEVHATVTYALRLLGFGASTAIRIPTDGQGRMRADELRRVLMSDRDMPTIVAAQAGNVNTGAFDPLEEIAEAVAGLGNAWLHVDGAFGFWAAASPELRHLVTGMDRADSWTTDAHKWLNVPYDCGIAIVREPRWQERAMALTAAYLLAADRERDSYDWVPEASRRARGTTVYAALRSLGRRGLAELIERDCACARRFAANLTGATGIRVLNDVVLNQVLVRFDAADPADVAAGDARTRRVIAAIQADGTMWAGGTTWHGQAAMRISVSSWRTTEADVDRSTDAVLRAARANPG